MTKVGIEAGALVIIGVAVMVWLANNAGMLWPSQMLARPDLWGKQWFSMTMKGDTYGNAALLPWVFLLVISFCGDQWRFSDVLVALVVGVVTALWMMKNIYIPGKLHDAAAGAGQIHSAGFIMTMILAATIALLLLYLLSGVPWYVVLAVGALLAIYIPLANHLPLVWLKDIYHWSYCPDVFREESKPMITIIISEFAILMIVVTKLIFPGSALELIHRLFTLIPR
ncbi:MAG: hypothetical protein V4474_03275 [Patescibacteria group bacterium]